VGSVVYHASWSERGKRSEFQNTTWRQRGDRCSLETRATENLAEAEARCSLLGKKTRENSLKRMAEREIQGAKRRKGGREVMASIEERLSSNFTSKGERY